MIVVGRVGGREAPRPTGVEHWPGSRPPERWTRVVLVCDMPVSNTTPYSPWIAYSIPSATGRLGPLQKPMGIMGLMGRRPPRMERPRREMPPRRPPRPGPRPCPRRLVLSPLLLPDIGGTGVDSATAAAATTASSTELIAFERVTVRPLGGGGV